MTPLEALAILRNAGHSAESERGQVRALVEYLEPLPRGGVSVLSRWEVVPTDSPRAVRRWLFA